MKAEKTKKIDKVEEMKKEFLNEFINALKEDKMPWEKGWEILLHKNLVSGIEYKGYNQLILMYVAYKKKLQECEWLTFNQAREKKLSVKKGAKSVPIQYFSYYDKTNKKSLTFKEYAQAVADGKREEISILKKYYNIFNVSDIEGYEPKEETEKKNDISMIENYIKKSELKIEFVGNQPCYIPSLHQIKMTPRKQFKNDDEYYSTLLHELSHSTTKHINREFPEDLTTEIEKYAFEELVAEISSVLLCCEFGIELQSIQNNKAYVQSWIEKLEKNKEKYLMKAIKNANDCTKYIMDNLN